MPSVLESSYIKPTRPYSQNELSDMRTKFAERYNLSDVFARHLKCKHFYKVKINGKKYNNIQNNPESDGGNCSVCWKLSKIPEHLYDNARDLIFLYEDRFQSEPKKLCYDSVDVETCYYKWIYENI